MKTRNIIFGAVLSLLVSFALCQQLRAAQDTPDPGSVSGLFNTADGDHALFLTTALLETQHLVGSRPGPTQVATSIPLSALQRWTSTALTVIRPLARRQCY